jgi:hypothetical protein
MAWACGNTGGESEFGPSTIDIGGPAEFSVETSRLEISLRSEGSATGLTLALSLQETEQLQRLLNKELGA